MHMHRFIVMTSVETPPDTGARLTREHAAAPRFVTGTDWSRATWALLVVLCGALFLDGLDISMVGVALPSMGQELDMSPSSLQWIVSAYVLGYGGVPLPRGGPAHPLPPGPRLPAA